VGVLEEIVGFLLGFVVLLDIFLLILYARANKTIMSTELSHVIWRGLVGVSGVFGRGRELFLTFSGPLILVTVLGSWALLLSVATALIIHPNLGTGITATQGETPTDFITALYVGGSSLSFIGASDFSPQDWFFRLFYLLTSLIGLTLASLIITYLMQLYENLKQRNALGLKVHLLSSETGDAAEVISRLAPHGKFDIAFDKMETWAADTAQVKESHHFYPMLFFFRFQEPFYSVSRTSLTSLDTVSLMKSALDNKEYGWVKESAAMEDIWRVTMMELQVLAQDFLPGEDLDTPPDQKTREGWRSRYEDAVARLKAADIKTTRDGAEDYISLRTQWDRYIYMLAPKMAYDLDKVDTAMAKVRQSSAQL